MSQVVEGSAKEHALRSLDKMQLKRKVVERHFSVPAGLTFFSVSRKRFAVCKSHVSRIKSVRCAFLGPSDPD